MNRKNLLSIAAFTVLGLIVGYAYFGKWGGDYVSLKTLLSFGGNRIHSAFRSISGIEEMRNNILICGAIGAVVGVLLTFKLKK
ncbi:MAG: hypothetical protein HY799_04285 [Nitrosomonadales bacterium]|nr:hypothetical protein [Nitrosomonadales bacterium]